MSEGLKTVACRGCGRPMIWVVLPTGKRCPLDAKPVTVYRISEAADGSPAGEPVSGVYLSHFVTCPDRDKFRKGGGRGRKT